MSDETKLMDQIVVRAEKLGPDALMYVIGKLHKIRDEQEKD